MTKHKPFSRTEMKILVYNRMQKGMSYEQACKDVKKEVAQCIKNSKTSEEKEKSKEKPSFKGEFKKLTDANKR